MTNLLRGSWVLAGALILGLAGCASSEKKPERMWMIRGSRPK